MKKIMNLWIIISLAVILSSCARMPVKPAPSLTQEIYPQLTGPIVRQDIFHVVAPGETLWRISKMYNVKIEDITRANNLNKSTALEIGQRLRVPQAAPIRPVIALFPSDKWKYIIIHHSATDAGSSLNLNELHKRRGWAGIGYDFVIDNGTDGKGDGQIEVSPRWIKQEKGAHCQAADMNSQGIGICLVGNFSKEAVSEKQMVALVYLVNILREYYKIPKEKIMGHGQVPGARTECPGKYFPWREFYSELNSNLR
ncbi:MAG: N-acetylmuramoyl-L-alanine amidase [Candidatus Omnitrophica bacterium]|nr:N-acetylmuramoyl-L-alanine amidase [Candidatus Omnitrophota bacterium]